MIEQLIRAIINGDINGATNLINQLTEPQLSVVGPYNSMPLHRAAHHDRVDVINLLTQKGVKIDLLDNQGCTALKYAIQNNSVTAATNLIGKMTVEQLRVVGTCDKMPLHWAAHHGVTGVVLQLIQKGVGVQTLDSIGYTALFYAKDQNIAQTLINQKAHVNYVSTTNKYTPLLFASQQGRTEVVKFLTDNGAKVNKVDNLGLSSLLHAANFEISQLLIGKGAIVGRVGNDGGTVLMNAVSRNNIEMVKLFIEKGVEVNKADNQGYTPLLKVRNLAIAQFLIEKGGVAKQVASDGHTVLIHAVSQNDIEMVKLFIENGAIEVINSLNSSNQTALSIATANNRAPIINLLKEKGALPLDIVKLKKTLKQNKKSTKLDLSKDEITPDGAKLIWEFLKTHNKVTDIDFGKDKFIKDDSRPVKVLAEAYIKDLRAKEKKEQDLKEVMEKVAEGNDRISGSEEKAWMLLGNTGSGKSTLANLLSGTKLQGIIDDETGDMIIDTTDNGEAIKISHNKNSETKIPNKSFGKEVGVVNKCKVKDDIVVLDCPGSNDTNVMQEIANSFYVKKLYSLYPKIKFIFVASESSITGDRGTSFVSSLKQFCNSFKDVELVKANVVLVITSVKAGKKVQHLKTNLEKILNQNETIDESHKKMLGYLINKIVLFHVPSEEGLLPHNTYSLFDLINQTGDFADTKEDIGKFSLTEKAIEYCHDLLKSSSDNLEKLVNIMLEAVKTPGVCTEYGDNNVLLKNYGIIKVWLPHKVTYIRGDLPKIHTSMENFIKVKHLKELSVVAAKIKDIKAENLEEVAVLTEKLYNLFEEYVVINATHRKEEAPLELKEKIQHFAYATKQMMEYCKLFSSLIDHKYQKDFSLEILSKKLFTILGDCNNILINNLKEAVINIEIDLKRLEVDYYQEAIDLLKLQGENPVCIKKQSLCTNAIANSKKLSNHTEESLKYYIESLKLDKTMDSTYDEVGDLFVSIGKHREAITFYRVTENVIKLKECFEHLINQNKSDYKLREEYGDMWVSMGMYPKAQKCYMESKSLVKEKIAVQGLCSKISGCQKNEVILKSAQLYEAKSKNGDFYDYSKIDLSSFEKLFSQDDVGTGGDIIENNVFN